LFLLSLCCFTDDLLTSQTREELTIICLSFSVSVRVANELGAKHPKAAKFSVVVAVITSAAVGLIFTLVALVARKQLPRLFTGDDLLVKETSKLGYLLAATISLNSIQPVLSGMNTSIQNVQSKIDIPISKKLCLCFYLSLAIQEWLLGLDGNPWSPS
jgi:Na+-driven multidrug efflux pump